ncbi:MAG: ABC transporter ATP-binding protein [bacterium]
MIELKNISKTYYLKASKVEALKDVSLFIKEGEFISIMGPSGSGKSTLLSIIGCLDIPTSGTYILDRKEVSSLSDDELSLVRNEKIGFVFQAFHLLPRFSALENVALPLIYKGVSKKQREERARFCLSEVGLQDRAIHNPSELSGGEQQRVAIARALSNSPRLILADEPTGNLDSNSAFEIMSILSGLNEKEGITIVVVTHNMAVANATKKVYQLKNGVFVNESP